MLAPLGAYCDGELHHSTTEARRASIIATDEGFPGRRTDLRALPYRDSDADAHRVAPNDLDDRGG
jgi:hypothetical protein